MIFSYFNPWFFFVRLWPSCPRVIVYITASAVKLSTTCTKSLILIGDFKTASSKNDISSVFKACERRWRFKVDSIKSSLGCMPNVD
jgi:hypothetical protein